MSKIKVGKTIISALLILMMLMSFVPAAFAAGTQTNFPLIALNEIDLIADQNTLYVAEFTQDPVNKLITATVSIKNGGTTSPLVIGGVGVQISFTDRVAPYAYNPSGSNPYDVNRMFLNSGPTDSLTEFAKYCFPQTTGFDTVGSAVVQNNSSGRFIGAKISAIEDNMTINIAPGGTAVIAKLYFMPTVSSDILSLDMFSFKWSVYEAYMIKLSTWIANGTRYVVSNEKFPTSKFTYVLSPSTFKLHVAQAPPSGLSADTVNRLVTNYDTATMEWSYDENGPYSSGAPVVKDTEHTVYVRKAGTAYSGNDAEYGNYKKLLPSAAVSFDFPPTFVSAKNDVSLTKTSVNKTSTDGKTHVNDTIEYTVIAKNAGHALSVWADAVMTDTMPAGVTFLGNVKLGTTLLTSPGGYTFSGGTLTVPLGNIYGGFEKKVTFDVKVNSDAYGLNIVNGVAVAGKDGLGGEDLDKNTTDGGGNDIVGQTPKPTVDDITEGDRTVTGKGQPGATIEVTFPGGKKGTGTVDGNGDWTVNVPSDVDLVAGNEVDVTQKAPGFETSEPVRKTVSGRPAVIKSTEKTSRNVTRNDGTRRVGDTLEYTITVKNIGPAKSLWMNVVITDLLPSEVDFVTGSVMINGAAAGGAASYNATTRTLTVNLGNIPGGVTKAVTFRAVINDTAYNKTFINTAIVDGAEVPEIIVPPVVVDRSKAPSIDEVNDGDTVITGTGIPGATITVLYPNSTLTSVVTVGTDGKWSANVPSSIILQLGQVVKATQTEPGLDPSLPAEAVVQAKKLVDPWSTKTSANLTSTDGKTHVNDKILYTITIGNNGSPKSVWSNIIVTDVIPDGLTLIQSSVKLDGNNASTSYNPTTRTLSITLHPSVIAGGTQKAITFECTVNADAFGKTIKNAATIAGKDGAGNDVNDSTEEDGDGRTVLEKSKQPQVDDVTRGDKEITGTGEPGADIVVTLNDGTKLETKVDPDGTWSVDVPQGKEPNTGDQIKVTQKEDGKDPSDPVIKIVNDKNYRAVKGFVWPMVNQHWGLGDSFLRKHDITVELRESVATPAGAKLSVKSVLVANSTKEGLGEFVIENVPFGTYVLYISRPGYLLRTMKVTVAPSSPDMIALAPPGTVDEGIFKLWWGDCTDDYRVDNSDIMMVMSLMNKGVNANSPLYDPACDFNGDGRIDNFDIGMILTNWNKFIVQYPGTDGVDFSELY